MRSFKVIAKTSKLIMFPYGHILLNHIRKGIYKNIYDFMGSSIQVNFPNRRDS